MKAGKIKIDLEVVVLIALGLLPGCATITRGIDDTLQVNSKPSGAMVEITRVGEPFHSDEIKANFNDQESEAILQNITPDKNEFFGPILGKTPAIFTLKRNGNYSIRITTVGYVSKVVEVKNIVFGKGSVGVVGNIPFGGLIGLRVDSSSGAMKDLIPNPVEVELEEE